jgi:pyruvate formate lyase activating enzyme
VRIAGQSPYGSLDGRYGRITALAMDPIEKKPLYHWRPGSRILSVGFAGCNLRCPFCQNWHISQDAEAPSRRIKPAELIEQVGQSGCGQIAYTYSEPLVHFEFVVECMKLARERNIANVIVTNGCFNDDEGRNAEGGRSAAGEILSLTDAANVDLKCYSAENYAKVLGGDLETVKAFIRRAAALGVHLEITTLVIPGFNDSVEEMDAAADFVASVELPQATDSKAAPPWHLSAYHPDWKWAGPDAPPATDPGDLLALARRAKARIEAAGKKAYVYIGNAPAPKEFSL